MDLTFILLSGGNGVGKDTFASRMVDSAAAKGCTVLSYSHEDLATDCLNACGWDGVKNASMRQLLKGLTELSEKSGKLFDHLKEVIVDDLANVSSDKVFAVIQAKNPSKLLSTLNYIVPDIVDSCGGSLEVKPTKVALLRRRSVVDPEIQAIAASNHFDYKFELSTGVENTLKAADALLDTLLNENN